MNTKGFYKKTIDGIIYASEYVQGPTYFISISTIENLIFPIDGWYYFDSEELATDYFNSNEYLTKVSVPAEVPLWAFRIILIKSGMWNLITQAIAQASPEEALIVQEYLEYGNFIERNSPMLDKFAHQLGLTDQEIDNIFIQAGSLKL